MIEFEFDLELKDICAGNNISVNTPKIPESTTYVYGDGDKTFTPKYTKTVLDTHGCS